MKVKILAHTPNPDFLVATAAKNCYSSSSIDALMEKQTDESIEKFINRLNEMGHCYDEDTEVLTENGFKKWRDVTICDKLATINPENGYFNGFEFPKEIVNKKYNGEMIYFKSNTVDLMVTPNHKIYCSISNTVQNRTNPIFSLHGATDILKTGKMIYESPIRMKTSASNPNTTECEDDALYKLYGFFIGDGYSPDVNRTSKRQGMFFHINLKRKINYLFSIQKEIKGMKINILKNNKYEVSVPNMNTYNFRKMFYNNNKEKTFPLSFLKMSNNQFRCFIDGLLNSDGHIAGVSKNFEYSTTSYELIERLQSLGSINGTNITYTISNNGDDKTKTCYRVYFWRNRGQNPMFNDSRNSKAIVEIKKYNGSIYCASVSTGLLVVRRNGKFVLSGNSSPLEHVSFTFAIEGVSRSLLAQLTRHRIASFSVQSQRYVNMNSFDYVIPKIIRDNPNALRVFENAIETDRNAYREIYDFLMSDYLFARYSNIGCPCDSKRYFYLSIKAYVETNGNDELKKKFNKDYKISEKIANENARSILPNATTTNIVMTMNVRELLHFFELRCCNRAQEEIRELADRMLVLCHNVSPLLFKNAGVSCMHGKCTEGNMSCGKPRSIEEYR